MHLELANFPTSTQRQKSRSTKWKWWRKKSKTHRPKSRCTNNRVSTSQKFEDKETLEQKIKDIKQEIKDLKKQKHDLEIDKGDSKSEPSINDTELKVWREKVETQL